MALTTHQINQAYVSVLGRAAIGTEIAKAAEAESVNALAATLIAEQQAAAKLVPAKNEVDVSTFSSLDSDVILNSKGASSTEFVENLYSTFLNRGSDEEGLAYWKGVLANGATKEEVVSAFKAAIIAQAAEGTEDYIAYQEAVAAKATAFLDYLYLTDLGRPSDEDGLAYWSGEIAKGATYAQIIEAFTAAAEAQGTKTDDGVAFANKLAIADHATEKLQAFSKTATAANIAAAKSAVKDQIAGVNSESGEDGMTSATENIDEIANTYKAPGSKSFTTDAYDKLGIGEDSTYNTTAATNFTGTYNVADPEKGTIQTTDSVYGNPAFANGNVLTVNVTGATATNKTYDLDTGLPTTVDGVANLVVKGSGVNITGTVPAGKYTNTVTIEAGFVDATNPAPASNITVAANAVIDTYKGGSKADVLILTDNTSKVSNIDLGSGKDTLKVTGVATNALADLGIKSLTSVEEIELTVGAATGSGAAIKYDAIKGNLSFNATNANPAGASGDLVLLAGDNKTIDVSKIINGKITDDLGTYTNQINSLVIDHVAKGATVTLQGAVDSNKMADVIYLSPTANDGKTVTSIKNFAGSKAAAGKPLDKIAVASGDAIQKVDSTNHFTQLTTQKGVTELKAAIDGVAAVKVTKGVVTFFSDAAGTKEIQISNVASLQKIVANAVTAGDTAIFDAKAAVAAKVGNDAYILDTGTVNTTNDDIIIKLIGLGDKIAGGIDATTPGFVTLA